jgi:hypothetical protein
VKRRRKAIDWENIFSEIKAWNKNIKRILKILQEENEKGKIYDTLPKEDKEIANSL